jgi:homoserine kinase type II
MSVYTVVDHAALEGFLADHELGRLVAFEGIAAGITNTNYFVDTERGRYVLTLFEHERAEDLPWFLNVMAFMAEHAVPSAHPIADRSGAYLGTLADKPAALVHCLRGGDVETPSLQQIETFGAVLGHMHRCSENYAPQRRNGRALDWAANALVQLKSVMPADDHALLAAEIAELQQRLPIDLNGGGLPSGAIHADLFRDNVLFDGERLSGIIDFYYACSGILLYDVAIAANDWCVTANGTFDDPKLHALLHGYQRERKPNANEQAAWPHLLRAGGVRFWTSRLLDHHFPRDGEMTHTKNPDAFRAILRDRSSNAAQYAQHWNV